MWEKPGKRRVALEDIPRLYDEGYRVRVKKVKEYRYITLNKDGRDMIVDRYSDELWGRLRDYRSERSIDAATGKKLADNQEFLNVLGREISSFHDDYKSLRCVFRRSDFTCGLWRWSEPPSMLEKYRNFMKAGVRVHEVRETGARIWTLGCGPLCRECPSYLDKAMIIKIKRTRLPSLRRVKK